MLSAVADPRQGVFTSREALAAGYTVDDVKSYLRTGRWVRLRKGVYVAREHLSAERSGQRHLLDSIAVLLSLAPGPVLSHASAARLHRLVVPQSIGETVRLTDTVQWRQGRGYRVARAALPPEDVVPWLAFASTSVARTLVDCAREWTQLDAVVAIDAALNEGLVTATDVAAAVHAARHRTGASEAARAFGLSDGRAESPLESEGRLRLVAAGLPAPELQVELHDARGFVARVDGWYEEAAVALEFDGRVKYSDPTGGRTPAEVLWQEKRREDLIRALGVRVVRVVKEDMGRGWPRVVAGIHALLGTPFTGPRAFVVVRRPAPQSDTDVA